MTSQLTPFLQVNLNHSARAQDLMLQSMAEWSIGVAIVSEPYVVPSRDNWVGDSADSVAIVVQPTNGAPPLGRVVKGRGFVSAIIGDIAIIGVYFSPNRTLSEFEQFLAEVGDLVEQSRSYPILVAGDLNAKSTAWGSSVTDNRGEELHEWATHWGLNFLNRGSANTCVRQRGGSVIDVTMTTASLVSRVHDWKVMESVETLSDHRYVRFDVSAFPTIIPARENDSTTGPRWVLGKLDRELAREAVLVETWVAESSPENADENITASQLSEALTRVCDASMPRAKPIPPKRWIYWWRPELRRLREECVAARRRYTRYRRRRIRDQDEEEQIYDAYRSACKTLQLAIGNAKDESWKQWLGSLDRDPWGRPYKTITRKLRPWTPPLTSSLEPRLVTNVVRSLFPQRETWNPPQMARPDGLSQEDQREGVIPPVSEMELASAVQKLRSKKTAPGPDGIPGRILAIAIKEGMEERVRSLFSDCLRRGRFPRVWKKGRLVLIRKPGRPAESPSAYRPIVLLDEAGKTFERVLASRIVDHLETVGPNLNDGQYGFRRGRSTLDAIARLRALAEDGLAQGGGVLAVSLDIANAFNTLPWETIKQALKFHGVPEYLQKVIADYLNDRSIAYPSQDGWSRWEMSCGVPQGSVLGPLLWNIGYDWVLRGAMIGGISVLCYADDTLVVARGSTPREAALRATAGVAQVVQRIQTLGLEVALQKSQALWLRGRRRTPSPGTHITVGGHPIAIDSTMKYLGIVLDGRWKFTEHFQELAPKLVSFAGMLAGLLPNLGGPSAWCRRLYSGVIRSKALYGAPIWSSALCARNQTLLRRAQRVMALRTARAYRTVSYEAVTVLANSPPWDLEAEVLATVYRQCAEAKSAGNLPLPEEIQRWRNNAREDLLRNWEERLEEPQHGRELAAAVLPVLRDWLDREHGAISYHLAQVLTGHGCFGGYLCRVVGREATPGCHHCSAAEDTAQHTREECPAWANLRADLAADIGADLSLPAIIRAMLESPENWDAVTRFAAEVMRQKEEAERVREANPLALPARQRRLGRRRRAYAQQMPP